MEYFFYCRDNPEVGGLRLEINENHQSFMDKYAERMIARGPTLAEDGVTATGSMHIVDLPDLEAARVFAYEEPNYKAGVYSDVMVRRWRNDLARTMWAFKSDLDNSRRFLVICHGKQLSLSDQNQPREAFRDFINEQDKKKRMIICGPMFSEDGSEWAGNVMMVESPSRSAVHALLYDDPYNRAGMYDDIEVHPWRFGGRV